MSQSNPTNTVIVFSVYSCFSLLKEVVHLSSHKWFSFSNHIRPDFRRKDGNASVSLLFLWHVCAAIDPKHIEEILNIILIYFLYFPTKHVRPSCNLLNCLLFTRSSVCFHPTGLCILVRVRSAVCLTRHSTKHPWMCFVMVIISNSSLSSFSAKVQCHWRLVSQRADVTQTLNPPSWIWTWTSASGQTKKCVTSFKCVQMCVWEENEWSD